MPIFACYIGSSSVTTAVQKKDGTFTVNRFPFVYSPNLFNSKLDESGFYKIVLEEVAKSFKAKLSDFELLIAHRPNLSDLKIDAKINVDVTQLFPKCDEKYIVLVEGLTVFTPDYRKTDKPGQDLLFKNALSDDTFVANLTLYPQLLPRELNEILAVDSLTVTSFLQDGGGVVSQHPIVFTGDRFAQEDGQGIYKYALVSDLLIHSGYYYVEIDTGNSVILKALLRKYDPSVSFEGIPEPEEVGTFALVPGNTEVLISSDMGTGQFFDIKKDSIFVAPLDVSSKSSVSIKNKYVGDSEGIVKGGTLGLVFDTREQRILLNSDIKDLNSFIREVGNVRKGI